MEIKNVPYNVINWDAILPEKHLGVTGEALWKVSQQGNVRVRIVEYSPGYLADHWCEKGHVVYVLQGEFTTELQDGKNYTLTKDMCYVVADHAEPHRSTTSTGVKLLIVD